MNLPTVKAQLFLILYVITVANFAHELGHLAVAQLMGLDIYEIEFLTFTPHIFVSNLNIPVLLAGQLFMPIVFYSYYALTKQTSPFIWFSFIGLLALGSSLDFYNIFILLSP